VTGLYALLNERLPAVVVSVASMMAGGIVLLPFVWKEMRSVVHL
jgi:hypothetical protein